MSDHDALSAELGQRLGRVWATPTEVSGLSALPGGASRQTLKFTATTSAGERKLVLRLDLAGPDGAAAMAREAAAMRAAAAAGVPAPAVVDHGTSAAGHPYLIMEYIAGETIPRRLLRDEQFADIRPTLAHRLGVIAARIHTIDPDRVADLPAQDPLDQLRALSDRYDGDRPTVELGLRWLRTHAPRRRPDTVVHGDLRNGNIIVGPDGVRAVLDWELTHRGNPTEDLGWLCVRAWRFGSALPVGGFGGYDQLLAGYQSVAGWGPDPDELRWWEVYGNLRWLLICRQQAAVHLRGSADSLEHAVVGRRVCEAEFDLLLALGHTAPHAVPDPLDALDAAHDGDNDRVPPHDAPHADHLLAVLARSLRDGDLAAALPGGKPRFLARVGANAIAIARREILLARDIAARRESRLAALGFTTEADLAHALRTETVDLADPAVIDAVVTTVHDKLLVANPAYLAVP